MCVCIRTRRIEQQQAVAAAAAVVVVVVVVVVTVAVAAVVASAELNLSCYLVQLRVGFGKQPKKKDNSVNNTITDGKRRYEGVNNTQKQKQH